MNRLDTGAEYRPKAQAGLLAADISFPFDGEVWPTAGLFFLPVWRGTTQQDIIRLKFS
jgi:hypothetical protein